MIRAITIVALGGALGSAARYMLSRAVGAYVHTAWPLATFAVNIIGCAAIGFISAVASRSPWMGENTRLFLTVGLCGGFTTFSTFCNEGLALMRGGHAMMAAAYAGTSVAMGVLAAAAGMALGRQVGWRGREARRGLADACRHGVRTRVPHITLEHIHDSDLIILT